MSEDHHILFGPDGTQFMLDVKSGKYYSTMTKNQREIAPKHDFPHGINLSPLQRSVQGKPTRVDPGQPRNKSHSTSQASQQKVNNNNNPVSHNDNNKHQTRPKQATTCSYEEQNASKQIQMERNTVSAEHFEQRTVQDNEENEHESPSPRNFQHDPTSTMNKRALNDSDDFTTISSNKARKNEHNKRASPELHDPSSNDSEENDENQNEHKIPLDHLQRAVVHNLPCFIINFQHEDKLPPAATAAEELYNHFLQQGGRIVEGFSVVRYVGNQLKVGVKSKEDYLILNNQKIWPSKIKDNPLSVTLPKFVPEQFSLVVRSIPREFAAEQVSSEVKRSAMSANNFRVIVYPYPRSTNDFRFTVADQNEYNGLLRLGRIGIGNRMHLITQYRPANKLTYCTKCWILGHTRNQCRYQTQRCKICLLEYNDSHNEVCSKIYQCAQCHQGHHSIDGDCKLVQKYRTNLNRAVKKAYEDGTLTTNATKIRTAIARPPPPKDTLSFPSLPTSNALRQNPVPPWTTAIQTTSVNRQVDDITNQQLYEKICARLEENSKLADTRIHKLEQESMSYKATITDLRQNLSKMAGLFKQIATDLIDPLMKATTNADKKKFREGLEKMLTAFNAQVDQIHDETSSEANPQVELNATMEDTQQDSVDKNPAFKRTVC